MASPQSGRKKGRSVLFAPLSFLLICLALILALSVFSRVSKIEVNGNSLYSDEEILVASGIEEGDNLFFINRFTARIRILNKLPYVEDVVINRALPNRVTIEVTESAAIAYVSAEDGFWAIDRGCKLLSRVDSADAMSLIRISGLSAIAPAVGDVVAPGEADSPKVSYLSALLTHISNLNMGKDITYLDISDLANPVFDYLGRFRVKMGSNEDLDYKFQLLLTAVGQLESGDSGTLDLSVDKRAHLTYD